MNKQSRKLVVQHLENVSSEILENYSRIISGYTKGRNGIYALFNGNKLYYVGLATNLRNRLKHHLKDRHSGLWDRFSLYLTQGDEHLREMESLVIRIASPKGNVQRMRFVDSLNLAKDLKKKMKEKKALEIEKIFGDDLKQETRNSKITNKKSCGAQKKRPLLKYTGGRTITLKAVYNDIKYKATVQRNGRINTGKNIFDSPSAAAKGLTGKSLNGWKFWKYRDENGKWVHIAQLRKCKGKNNKSKTKGNLKHREPALAPYVKSFFFIKKTYKGTEYKATALKDGTIKFMGRIFTSPSVAAIDIVGRTVNGWKFWKYKNNSGEWVKLDELRKK